MLLHGDRVGVFRCLQPAAVTLELEHGPSPTVLANCFAGETIFAGEIRATADGRVRVQVAADGGWVGWVSLVSASGVRLLEPWGFVATELLQEHVADAAAALATTNGGGL